MFSHDDIWIAIDRLAAQSGKSPSALARAAGLDPTSFNRSKRTSADGRPRWPSTESIARILTATNASFEAFAELLPGSGDHARRGVPLVGMAQAGSGGFFGENGLPQGEGWDAVEFPGADDGVFAIEVQGESMLPLYRDGDVLIVEPGAQLRRGDRVVVRTREGEVLAKVLKRRSGGRTELASLNPEHEDRSFDDAELHWIARVVWASQ